MENKKTLYLVVSEQLEIMEDILEVFDSAEQAQLFIDRYKFPKTDKMVIIERELNPAFHTDRTKTPYVIAMNYRGQILDIYPAYFSDDINAAFPSSYEFRYLNSGSIDGVDVNIYLLSKSKKEASKMGKLMHKDLIDSGQWEKKWLEHQASKQLVEE